MKYEKIKYPDGQISVKLTDIAGDHVIKKSILSYEDLIEVVTVGSMLNDIGIEPALLIKCLIAQRSDRKFKPLESCDLQTVTRILNLVKFRSVGILDPHSQGSIDMINRGYRIDPDFLGIIRKVLELVETETSSVLVSPDAGAYKRIFEYGVNHKREVVGAMKLNAREGNIKLQITGDVAGKNCLVIDDLADGGYTFILLGKALKNLGAANLYLYVSHGYFTKGFEELGQYYTKIFTTDSVREIKDPLVTQFKLNDWDSINTNDSK